MHAYVYCGSSMLLMHVSVYVVCVCVCVCVCVRERERESKNVYSGSGACIGCKWICGSGCWHMYECMHACACVCVCV